ncbi:hypothetical protein HF576_01870 [Microbacterium sp. CFH 90308]|uniref:Uncharacterized protein n=1 Tax=Microbacterium salsuginis TaxID=2722803 RepID=A0ABX1K6F3_9MICO|nr:hypothetical protein [Microbacterium sp. CFH 90308]NLP82586.1 hypothetical protein [Microbacterium sp. CFH 90308]
MKAPEDVTPEDLAPYGIGAPDAEGWYTDYRPLPPHLRPSPPAAPVRPGSSDKPAVEVDGSWYALLSNWRLVVADLKDRGIDLYDPVVLAGPWLSIRAAIFSLIDSNSRLRAALTRR